MLTFRFDDICLNTDMCHVDVLAAKILARFPQAKIQYAVSLMCNDNTDLEKPLNELVFRPIYKAYSAHNIFYQVERFGLPANIPDSVEITSHGLIHADHRLLDRGAQEMSILVSCSLLHTQTFTPPFNKWNKDTTDICAANGIYLQRFEDGWRGVEHCEYNPAVTLWYLHSRMVSVEQIGGWLR